MKKPKWVSTFDALGNTAFGFGLAILAQSIFWPLLGFEISSSQNFISVGIMTALSFARNFSWSRFMEAIHVRTPLSAGMTAIIAERERQKTEEGWDAARDLEHAEGELAAAGASYALYAGKTMAPPPIFFPWPDRWWKHTDFRRNLVKAGALIVAELDRFDAERKMKKAAVKAE